MALPKLLSTADAAKAKNCSRNTILDAIKKGLIDGVQTGRYYVVQVNRKFQDWTPNPIRQKIGRQSQKK